MKNILFTIDSLEAGGAEAVFLSLVREINRKEFLPIVAVHENSWLARELIRHEIDIEYLVCSGSFDLGYLNQLRSLVRKHHVDLVHCHLFGSSVYCSMLRLFTGIPVVSTFHGTMDVGDSERFLRVKSWILRLAKSRIVFVSKALQFNLSKRLGLPRSQSEVIYNGVDGRVFREKNSLLTRADLGAELDAVLIGAVGHVRPWKGYDMLFRAMARLKNEQKKYQLVLVGGDDPEGLDALRILRSRLNLDREIILIGERDDVPDILNMLDIYVLASSSEGFSLSTVEAMLCGVPVVVTNCGGPEEIVTNNVTGWIVDVDSDKQLAAKIVALDKDGLRTSEIAARGAEFVREKFTLTSMIRSYEELYCRLIADN